MHNYKIANKAQLESWLEEQAKSRDLCVAEIGEPLKDAVYSDGEKVTNPITIAWKNVRTNEVYSIEYERIH